MVVFGKKPSSPEAGPTTGGRVPLATFLGGRLGRSETRAGQVWRWRGTYIYIYGITSFLVFFVSSCVKDVKDVRTGAKAGDGFLEERSLSI